MTRLPVSLIHHFLHTQVPSESNERLDSSCVSLPNFQGGKWKRWSPATPPKTHSGGFLLLRKGLQVLQTVNKWPAFTPFVSRNARVFITRDWLRCPTLRNVSSLVFCLQFRQVNPPWGGKASYSPAWCVKELLSILRASREIGPLLPLVILPEKVETTVFYCYIGWSPGGGNGTSLQYSCLENSMGRGAWRATVHGVAKSWTWLSDWTHTSYII